MSTKSTSALDVVRHQNQMSNSSHVTTAISTPKTNHVSTVLLYDIPIVSLYIEGQERLCLAQISNTLLKQFSYNEIHNRRVALGITCVQCTPVQLEILRRAGAMPVSSRRCGMITRREAERLCKSFLGDNAPPRLPDDFAFSVHHKCAWGCHGSFLPARYNSSRAKCIKCSYCGLFFSPNKFIFHSHRISANDKYIQPDAANFNSWRRHMTLSGHLPDEIVYAWEDVKAMFNGGTRKRLMSTSHSPAINRTTMTQQHTKRSDSVASDAAIVLGVIEERHSETYRQSPKRLKESCSIGAVTAAAVVGVTAVATTVSAVSQQLPITPFNIHAATAVMPENGPGYCEATSGGGVATTNGISIMPFSHSFMMDYMWHAHAVQNAAQLHQQHQKCNGSNAEAFSFPNCSLPWIKKSNGVGVNGSRLFEASCVGGAQLPTPHIEADNVAKQQLTPYDAESTSVSASVVSSTSQIAGIKIFREPTTALPDFLKSSAFKPVIQHQHQQLQQERPLTVAANTTASTMLKAGTGTATLVSTSVYTSAAVAAAAAKLSSSLSSSTSSSPSSSSSSSLSNAAVVQAASMTAASPTFGNRTKFFNASNSLMHLLPPPTSPLLPIPRESLKSQRTFSVSPAIATKLPMNNVMEKSYLRSPTSEELTKLRASISFPVTKYLKKSQSSEEDEADAEDDELVDIETTEDDYVVLQNYQHHEAQSSPTPRQRYFLPTGGQICQRKYERCNSMDEIIVDGDDDSDTCNVDTPSVNADEMPHIVKVTVNQAACEESVQLCMLAKRNSSDDIERIKTDRPSSIEIVENSNESMCEVLSKSEDVEAIHKSETLCNLDTTSLTTSADVSSNIESDKNETAENAVKVVCYSPNLKILNLPKSKQQQQQLEKKYITAGSSLETTSAPATTTTTITTASITTKTGTISNTSTDAAVYVEALTCCSNNNNNNINNNNNNTNNNNNNEFWHSARLSLQHHPTSNNNNNFEQQQQFRSHYQQQEHQAIYNIPFQIHRQQQQQQKQQPLQLKQDLQLQQQQYAAAAAAHELLTSKHFRVTNNFRYLSHESQPRQANGVG